MAVRRKNGGGKSGSSQTKSKRGMETVEASAVRMEGSEWI